MLRVLGRLTLSLLPLALTPIFGFLLAEGYVNLGGGCKDILALIPWIAWAFGYFLFSLLFWWKRVSIPKTMIYAAAGATGLLALIFVILLLFQAKFLGLKLS